MKASNKILLGCNYLKNKPILKINTKIIIIINRKKKWILFNKLYWLSLKNNKALISLRQFQMNEEAKKKSKVDGDNLKFIYQTITEN